MTSWLACPASQRPHLGRFLFTTPLLSPRPRPRHFHTSRWITLVRFALSMGFLFTLIGLARMFMVPLDNRETLLVAPVIYFFTEMLGSFGQLFFFKVNVPPIHHHPLKSRSLSEFWGRRWNLWIQDWLKDVTRSFAGNSSKKLVATFIISGLFHELMVNLPYYICYRENTFGNMMLYFALQGLGLWIEKRFLRRAPELIKRIYLWILVLLPAPLFINRPMLEFLGLNG